MMQRTRKHFIYNSATLLLVLVTVAVLSGTGALAASGYENNFVNDLRAGSFFDRPGVPAEGAVLVALESSSVRPAERPINEGVIESQDIAGEDLGPSLTEPALDIDPVKTESLPEKSEPAAVKVEKALPAKKPLVASPAPVKTAEPVEEAIEAAPVKIPVVKKPAVSESEAAAVKVEKALPVEKPLAVKPVAPKSEALPTKAEKSPTPQKPVSAVATPVPVPAPSAKAVVKGSPEAESAAIKAAKELPEDKEDKADKYDGPIDVRIKRLYGFDAKLSGTPLGWVDQIYIDDLNNEVYLLDTGNERIVVTNIAGGYIFSFNYSMAGIKHPIAFTVDTLSGEIYLSDTNRIAILNYRGEYQGDFNLSQMPGSKTISIQSLCFVKSDDGDLLYLGDSRNRRIMVFTIGGKYVRTIGGSSWVGNNITGLYVNKDTVFWLDNTGYSVKSIGLDGKNKRSFGRLSSLLGGFSMPADMAVDDLNKRIVVVDANRMMIIFFDYNGNTLFEFGGPRVFSWPRAAVVDKKGHIFVADNTGSIMVFEVIPLATSDK